MQGGEHEQSLSDLGNKMCQSARGRGESRTKYSTNNSFKVPKFDENKNLQVHKTE